MHLYDSFILLPHGASNKSNFLGSEAGEEVQGKLR